MANTLIVQWWRVLTSVLALLLISQSVAGQNEIRDQSRHTISAELSTEAAKRASVTIVEYSDFQCPYCKRAASVVSQVRAAYGNSVKIVFKQMPLPFHQHAFKAAQASVCSAQQGKFWEFHDRVFASTDLSVDGLTQIASEAGLKAGEFNACLESEASRAVVEKEIQEASRLGVTGTPTFVINGRKIVGAVSFEVFKREIDREIMRAQNPTPADPPAKSINPAIEILNGDNALVDARNAGVQKALREVVPAANQPPQATATVTSTGVNLSPSSVAFGYQLVGTASNQIVETVTNLSNSPLIITDISVSGRDRRDFIPTYSFTLPVTVASGNSIAINLTFTPLLPWRAGTRNARLEIAEKNDSQYVTLTGIGATCGGPLPACSSGCADADGDGLNDAWEMAGGIDLNNDGVVDATHDLLLHGADPNKPDIFVQYDWMDYGLNDVPCQTDSECTSRPGLGHAGETCTGPPTPYSAKSCVHACVADTDCTALGPSHIGDRCVQNSCEHTHDPEVLSPGALQATVDAFAAHGFNLHILRGRALPHSHVVSFRTPEANCEGANVSPGTLGAYAVNLYDLKNLSFDQAKVPAFHYSVFGHLSSCDNDPHCDTPTGTGTCPTVKGSRPQIGQTGQAEVQGNDFIVSLGHFVNDLGGTPKLSIFGGTFMHELGHNLGLHHGGGTSAPGMSCVGPDCEDGPQFKPNYLSVMNYRYQTTGIIEGDAVGSSAFRSCSTDADCSTSSGARCEHFGFGGICLRLDYSSQVLPTGGNTPGALTENGQLNEPAGLGSGTSDLFSFDDGQCSFVPFAATHGPVNWDGVELPDNPNARSDLNTQDHPLAACTVTNQTLRGHTDWGPALGQSIFTMAFQCTSNGLDDRASLSEGLADKRVADSGQISQGELAPEMAAAAHVLYPPRPVRLQIDPELPLTRQSKSRPSTRTVTLLGTEDLDVTEIDQTSLRVGGLVPLSVLVRDVDRDGRADLIVEFDSIQLTSRANAEKIRVSGWLKNSQVFIGDAELTSKRVASSESVFGNDPIVATQARPRFYRDREKTDIGEVTNSAAPALAAAQTAPIDAGLPKLSIADVTVSEASCNSQVAMFTVTISAPYGKNVTVQYATANGTAIAGTDYTSVSGTLIFPRGSKAAQTITVPITDVLIPGPNKNFFVNLSSSVNATVSRSQGTATIQSPSVAKCQSCNLSCDDGNPCTQDSCNATLGCKHVNASATATPYCTLAGLGITPAPDLNFATANTSREWIDSDGDGFSDAAEIQGYIDINGNGVYDAGVDVPLPDADPHVPDVVYLYYDYVAAGDHDHNPPASAINLVKESFAAHGVNLHIDPNHHSIPESDAKVVTLLATAPSYIPDPACSKPSAKSTHQLRAIYPDVALLTPAYHYVVFGHYSSCDTASHCLVCAQDPECGGGSPPPFGALGSGEINGDDVIVSLGFFTDHAAPIPDETWAGVLMHELGHNLGLKHGGPDCDNYKPNYLSVMNYNFSNHGIPVGNAPGDNAAKACATDADCGPPPVCPGPECEAPAHCSAATHQCYRLDFSSFQYSDLPESGLNEMIGLTGRPNGKNLAIWTPDRFANIYYGPTNGAPIDWNHDTLYQNPSPAVDINGDGSTTLLAASNDWAFAGGVFTRLNFAFQCTSNFADTSNAQNQPTFLTLIRNSGQARAATGPPFDWLKNHYEPICEKKR